MMFSASALPLHIPPAQQLYYTGRPAFTEATTGAAGCGLLRFPFVSTTSRTCTLIEPHFIAQVRSIYLFRKKYAHTKAVVPHVVISRTGPRLLLNTQRL